MGTAKYALDAKDYDSCVSRCYYTMFFLAEAVIFTMGLRASSHKEVMILFGEYFLKTGIFESELGKALSYAYDMRLIGDYGASFIVAREEAEDLLETAQNFVQKTKIYLEKWFETAGEV